MGKLLAWFRASEGLCRLEEFESVFSRLHPKQTVKWCWKDRIVHHEGGDQGPVVFQWLPTGPSDLDYAKVAAGCVACHGIFSVWGQGESLESCAQSISFSAEQQLQMIDGSWCFRFQTLGHRADANHQMHGDRVEVFRHSLGALVHRKVDVQNPDHTLWLVQDHQRDVLEQPLNTQYRYRLLHHIRPKKPLWNAKQWRHKLSLSRRAFLSTSTLPVERSLSMIHLGMANRHGPEDTMLDPFCGSGGLLLTAAAQGWRVVGGDIQKQLLSNDPKPIPIPPSTERPKRGIEAVCMVDNFMELGLSTPILLPGMDAWNEGAATQYLAANAGKPYRAIITDPPYGRREFLSGKDAWVGEVDCRIRPTTTLDTFTRLLELGTQVLLPNGRLVFHMPVAGPDSKGRISQCTLHDHAIQTSRRLNYRLISWGVEPLNSSLHRVLVVLEKDVGAQAMKSPQSLL